MIAIAVATAIGMALGGAVAVDLALIIRQHVDGCFGNFERSVDGWSEVEREDGVR